MDNNELSRLVNNKYCRCKTCKFLDTSGRCNKTGEYVDWYIENNYRPDNCPRKK